jgi:hypothetical protein
LLFCLFCAFSNLPFCVRLLFLPGYASVQSDFLFFLTSAKTRKQVVVFFLL